MGTQHCQETVRKIGTLGPLGNGTPLNNFLRLPAVLSTEVNFPTVCTS